MSLERHVAGQPADVVVRLDLRRRAVAAGRGRALDDVRVGRALHHEVDAPQLVRLLLEDVDELLADACGASSPGR